MRWSDKIRVLSSSVRASLFAQSHIIVKDDLLPEERLQQEEMRAAMNAMYAAKFYPAWRRSVIVWFVNGKKFQLFHADVVSKSAEDVVNLAKRMSVPATTEQTTASSAGLAKRSCNQVFSFAQVVKYARLEQPSNSCCSSAERICSDVVEESMPVDSVCS